jgi:hypothetical protein
MKQDNDKPKDPKDDRRRQDNGQTQRPPHEPQHEAGRGEQYDDRREEREDADRVERPEPRR